MIDVVANLMTSWQNDELANCLILANLDLIFGKLQDFLEISCISGSPTRHFCQLVRSQIDIAGISKTGNHQIKFARPLPDPSCVVANIKIQVILITE